MTEGWSEEIILRKDISLLVIWPFANWKPWPMYFDDKNQSYDDVYIF